MCICPECEELDHPDHDTISIEAQWKETKVRHLLLISVWILSDLFLKDLFLCPGPVGFIGAGDSGHDQGEDRENGGDTRVDV